MCTFVFYKLFGNHLHIGLKAYYIRTCSIINEMSTYNISLNGKLYHQCIVTTQKVQNENKIVIFHFCVVTINTMGVLLFVPRREKPAFCICENKDTDQLRGNREADQRLCFRLIDKTTPPLSNYEISSIYM